MIRKFLYHPYLAIVLRLGLGSVLLIAGSLKLFDMAGFADSIENYRMMPLGAVNFVGIVLPPIEMLTGLALITGLLYPGALTVATFLFIVFFGAVNWALIIGVNIACGCFGTESGTTIGLQALLRNTFFLLALAPLWLQLLSKDDQSACAVKFETDQSVEQSGQQSGAQV